MFLRIWARDTRGTELAISVYMASFLGDEGIHIAPPTVCFPHSTQPTPSFSSQKIGQTAFATLRERQNIDVDFNSLLYFTKLQVRPFLQRLTFFLDGTVYGRCERMLPMFLTGSCFRIASPTNALQTLHFHGDDLSLRTKLHTTDIECPFSGSTASRTQHYPPSHFLSPPQQ